MAASWSNMKIIYHKIGIKLYKTQTIKDICHSLNIYRYCTTSAPNRADSGKKQYVSLQYTCSTLPGDKKDTSCELPTVYSPQYVEAAWYDWWLKQGYFSPKEGATGTKKFVICLPPPNVTGTLHLGHAITCAVQDALVRWSRMKGHKTVWIPGCDHAGIATQVVVEKQLWKDERKTRHDLGREEFLRRVWKWKDSKGDTIYNQMKKMGASLDWERACFTMDTTMSEAVTEAFVRLHDEGLIYRSNRLVNWSCQLKSAISDIEVENVSLEGPTRMSVPGYSKPQVFGEMASFDYPVVNSDERITVSTTRLETMLGDTAIAIHPEDPRYKHLHSEFVQHPLVDRQIPIICDDYVDLNFGTGAVKITPAHDHNDCNIGIRHNLESINVINDSGEMENVPDHFMGMKRFDARRKVAEALGEKGLFKGKQPHSMVLPVCSRSKDVIEPRLKAQWYVNCEEMASDAIKAVESGSLTFTPEFYKKIWYEFLKDDRSSDWCISRQIWWGHRIPAYKVILKSKQSVNEEIWISAHTKEDAYVKAEKQLGLNRKDFTLQQDEDVLDTWFSSALFPFSVHGWPDQTADLSKYYPSSLLETGSDIIFFWVARMVMMGQKMTGQLPFSKVLLHGILRDAQGRKMSKSLGNVIDPMDVIHGISLEELNKQVEESNLDPKEIELAKKGQKQDFPNGIPECGTDALRFALCSYNFKDPEINMNILHVQSYRNFCNKIWQGYRYVSDKLGPDFNSTVNLKTHTVTSCVDRWILSRLSHLVSQCEEHFTNYDLHYATQALYSFWFSDFCDIYLEYTKQLSQSEDADISTVKEILYLCTNTYLCAISPFMPYLSEELYQRLAPRTDSICVAEYPSVEKYIWGNEELDREMDIVREIRRVTLSLTQTFNLSRKHVEVYIQASSDGCDMLSQYMDVFNALLRVKSFTLVSDGTSIPAGCVQREVSTGIVVHLKLQGLVEPSATIEKFEKKVTGLQKKLDGIERKLRDNDKDQGDNKKMDSYRNEIETFQKYINILKTFDKPG
ncbi:valine--tRNA ligase-like [Mercenaria mercenaria]|uniref:valine--tRNA ligase-like n=1 Tax=Mercenaria mercenaria TaxID=6596 RepID=UPI00234EB007|nr:valine--tRNA ligase-like [Mercenaria mercenaria]